jgi:hypothetical protein
MTSQTINPSLFQKAIAINSCKKITGVSANFQQRIELPPNNKFTKISLLHASIPKGWYMLDDYVNFTLTETQPGPPSPPLSVTFEFPRSGSLSLDDSGIITGRNFTTSEIASELEYLLNTNSPNGDTYTVTFISSNGRFKIDSAAVDYSLILTNPTTEDSLNLNKYLGDLKPDSFSNTIYSRQRVNLQRLFTATCKSPTI